MSHRLTNNIERFGAREDNEHHHQFDVPISSAVLKQFTESGGQSVKLLIPLNSCTPNCGFGALLPTSKSTPRNSGRAEELRTSERRLDKIEFASLSSSFPLVSVDDDDIIRILCVVRQHDIRDEDEDDDEGGLRVIGTTCAHNIASMIVVVVKL